MQQGSDGARRQNEDESNNSPLFTPSPSPRAEEQNDDDVAVRTPLPLPGAFYFTGIVTDEEAYTVIDKIGECAYFNVSQGRDQVVLFGSHHDHASGLPTWSQDLLALLELRLARLLPSDAFDVVFARSVHRRASGPFARQFILNTYSPGQGIAPHIDIPHRFRDGIMILSFGSGITMDFEKVCDDDDDDDECERDAEKHTKQSLYLAPNSICVLTGESRWRWTHGIAARTYDLVRNEGDQIEHLLRGQRLSITIRWLNIERERDHDDETCQATSSQLRH